MLDCGLAVYLLFVHLLLSLFAASVVGCFGVRLLVIRFWLVLRSIACLCVDDFAGIVGF